jgi:hypothetical protein
MELSSSQIILLLCLFIVLINFSIGSIRESGISDLVA